MGVHTQHTAERQAQGETLTWGEPLSLNSVSWSYSVFRLQSPLQQFTSRAQSPFCSTEKSQSLGWWELGAATAGEEGQWRGQLRL